MVALLLLISSLFTSGFAATIAIIDTGFDLDHEFLKPKVFKQETDEEALSPKLQQEFKGWNFSDNSHLKESVLEDPSSLEEILHFRTLKAKGHREGLSMEEFEWFKKRNSDKEFMEKFKKFKKHSHGTFVAGIALREGDNINIFPIRGLNIEIPVVAVEAASETEDAIRSKSPEEKFKESIRNSLDRVSRKFDKICRYLSRRKIEVVNASYGITHKNIRTKFSEKYFELTGKEISEEKLEATVTNYFDQLYKRGTRTIKRYPNTLFIFSAGNSGIDNDAYHHYPSKIKLPNTMSVAAMNGDYLASFSNYGLTQVDVGAPGVAILSVLPSVYSSDGKQLYSPASGTSMAAPYVSNLAAQILNANSSLKPQDVKKIIMETGNTRGYLKRRLISGASVDNEKALKAAQLSREMGLDEAITLAKSDLIPLEDKINLSITPAVPGEKLKQRVMDALPRPVAPDDVEDSPLTLDDEVKTPEAPTNEGFSSPKDQGRVPPDTSAQLPSAAEVGLVQVADQVPSSQTEEPPRPPSAVPPSLLSPPESPAPETRSQESGPSSP